MNSPTLDTLIGRVRAELSEADAEFFTDSAVTTMLNAGQDAITNDCPWTCVSTFTILTVSGSASYMLPDETTQPTAVYFTAANGRRHRLDYAEPDVMDGWTNYGSRTVGTPNWATYKKTDNGVEMTVWPAPSVTGLVLTVETMTRPADLVAATDRTELHPRTIPILVDYTLSRLKAKDEELQQSNAYVGSYENGLKDLRARHMIEQADQFNRTRLYRGINRRGGRWGYG